MATHIRIDKKTPSGGAYAEIYFFDADGNPVDEDKAACSVIRECTKEGVLIKETWCKD